MPQQAKRINSFQDKARPATITKVNPQKKTVDIKYLTQQGEAFDLVLPYEVVGVSWGRLHMPQVGDRVMIDYGQGEAPYIVAMKPIHVDYLPYLDPGELVEMNSDGSFIHMRNGRRRVNGELIDYDATKGPNGETVFDVEPGGIVMGIRSKKDINSKAPRWYEHSYLSMFDNGDVSLQSRFRGKERGLLYMDGASGYVILTAGDTRPQEYIELDPLNQSITIFSDGDTHHHNQKDWKITVYNNEIQNISNALQINVGVLPSAIPADFDNINPDVDLGIGDIRISNSGTLGSGKFYLHVNGDANLLLDKGNFNVTTLLGGVNVISHGDVNVTTTGSAKVTAAQNATISAAANAFIDAIGAVYLNNHNTSDPVITLNDLINAIQTHVHPGVQLGASPAPLSTTTPKAARKVFA